ncbi:MAG: hypothetical protein IJD22_03815 [Clostridia bacterium]|nr:hypothetical protein [Clostridia bacterium]
MYDKPYLELYDDSEIIEMMERSKEAELTAREFAELVYIPWMLTDTPEVFLCCLEEQGGSFLLDVFHRSYEIYGESLPYTAEQFSSAEYKLGENVFIEILELPRPVFVNCGFLQIVLVADFGGDELKLYLMGVEKGQNEELLIRSMDLETFEWRVEGPAPTDAQKLADLAVELTVNRKHSYSHYVKCRCPLCQKTYSLGLTADEAEGYKEFRSEDAELEDVIPALNTFEREFLMTGMCPECQSSVFRKELPANTDRWMQGDE